MKKREKKLAKIRKELIAKALQRYEAARKLA